MPQVGQIEDAKGIVVGLPETAAMQHLWLALPHMRAWHFKQLLQKFPVRWMLEFK